MSGSPCKILVYLDNKLVYVPERVSDTWAFRGALGLRRGEAVVQAQKGGQNEIVTALNGFVFESDMRFSTVGADRLMYPPTAEDDTPTPDDDPTMPWDNDGDGWKGS